MLISLLLLRKCSWLIFYCWLLSVPGTFAFFERDSCCVTCLPSEQEFPLLGAGGVAATSSHAPIFFLQFFDSVGVTQSIQSMFATCAGGRNIGDHRCLAVASEGVFEHLSELASSERRVFLVQIESSDALFQGK